MVEAPPRPVHPHEPRVSIIVPAYGVAHLLGEALASLQAQTLHDWEAIVVDDGAQDDVEGAFSPFAHDVRMRLLQTDNGGPAMARNRAIAVARAPFIALLDGDDLYAPGYLQRMLARIETDERLGFVSCDALVFGDGQRRLRPYSDLYPLTGPVTLERVLTREVVIFTAAILRRSAFEAVGRFDESLWAGEDLDLWIRLLAGGWRGAFLDEPLARYRRRRNSLSRDGHRMQLDGCALYRKAVARLAGRPEQAAALRGLAGCEQRLSWAEGELMLRAGNVAGALQRLTAERPPSTRWRLALAVMRRLPATGGLLLKLRDWLPPPVRVSNPRPNT